MDRFIETRSSRATRPLTVDESVTIRDDATFQPHDTDVLHAESWSNCLRSFLTWYNDYRNAHLVFVNPEGETVRSQMPNSHQPRYGNKYYAKLMALERQIIAEYDSPSVALLTLSGSSKNANGGWRCPADHLRDVVDSWRPDDGRGVYHALRDSLAGREWEYALVAEHHESGYGHIHVAVFVDGDVSEAAFRPAIDAHLRECSIAGPEAHDYFAEDEQDRPISLRSIATDRNRGDTSGPHGDGYTDDGPIQNLGTYIGEYIGAHGDALFERELGELQFRAVCWATGTQRVRFSVGANELIAADLGCETDSIDEAIISGWQEDVTEADIDAAAESDEKSLSDLLDGDHSWNLRGIGQMTREGESVYDAGQSSINWVSVEDEPERDPPRQVRFARPERRKIDAEIDRFGGGS